MLTTDTLSTAATSGTVNSSMVELESIDIVIKEQYRIDPLVESVLTLSLRISPFSMALRALHLDRWEIFLGQSIVDLT